MTVGCIYKITNKINGMSYIGQTIQPLHARFNNHCGPKSHCKYLRNAILSYGRDEFVIESLLYIKSDNRSNLRHSLNIQESKLIKEFNTVAPNGYNLTSGGDCAKMSAETVLANAEKHKKPIKCNETGQIWSSIKECAESFGVKPERINRILRGVRDHFKGMSFSYVNPERSKPKKVRQKKIRSTESYNLDGFSAQREKAKRPIKCIETGQEWSSIQEAADHFGVRNESIHRVLRGIRKHFRELTFSYIL